MELIGSNSHLTYCTNIHPGETWQEVAANLARYLPEIKTDLTPDKRMGIGLRLSAKAAAGLSEPGALESLRDFLKHGDYYVFTFNGFPFGTFHGSRVKADVYRPDWSEPERLAYTNQLADLMARLLAPDLAGSISTVPGTFKSWVEGKSGAEGRVQAITENLLAHVAHLVRIEQTTGRVISLALEPEPCCLLETVAETIDFFQSQLFTSAAVKSLQSATGLSAGAADKALHEHIGICYDVCHAAVEFEDPRASIGALRDAGILISKVQLSSALKITNVSTATARQMQPFDEPVYLHQVVQANGGELTRFTDLPEALQHIEQAYGSEWRCHFHVPVFLEQMREFSTTQSFLRDILALHRQQQISEHLEVETYTWDVLPDQYRNVSVSKAVARELAWVIDQLEA